MRALRNNFRHDWLGPIDHQCTSIDISFAYRFTDTGDLKFGTRTRWDFDLNDVPGEPYYAVIGFAEKGTAEIDQFKIEAKDGTKAQLVLQKEIESALGADFYAQLTDVPIVAILSIPFASSETLDLEGPASVGLSERNTWTHQCRVPEGILGKVQVKIESPLAQTVRLYSSIEEKVDFSSGQTQTNKVKPLTALGPGKWGVNVGATCNSFEFSVTARAGWKDLFFAAFWLCFLELMMLGFAIFSRVKELPIKFDPSAATSFTLLVPTVFAVILWRNESNELVRGLFTSLWRCSVILSMSLFGVASLFAFNFVGWIGTVIFAVEILLFIGGLVLLVVTAVQAEKPCTRNP
jgi:hypothetical protein